jgi:glycosyltransferase involved in cell wall biosynthesis
MEADILLYPAIYEELFCIAVAEAQCVGTYPVTSSVGALETTNMGRIVPERPDIASNDAVYVDAVVELLSDRNRFAVIRTENKVKAKIRFSPERILKEWERVFV